MAQQVSGFLRSEFRFLHKPLNLTSRLLLLAAAVAIAVSLFFPLWKMHLVAPQYSDGLDLYIFPYKIILMLLRAVVFGAMGNVVDLFALYSYFGVFSIASFWYRLYQYGHSLDPHAPVHIQPFTPRLIGVQQIANFREFSYPETGAYLLCVSVLLIILAGWFSRKEKPA